MTPEKHLPRSILTSKRANIYYLEHCRVLVRGGAVEFATPDGDRETYWNIPIANTTFLLLGNGTSITQAAMRMLAVAGVVVGFSGGGGTPLVAGVDIAWIYPQTTYASTEYLAKWLPLWQEDSRRLAAAKRLQQKRLDFTVKWWSSPHFAEQGFSPQALTQAAGDFAAGIQSSTSTEQLLGCEGDWTRKLYALAAASAKTGPFSRDRDATDRVNQLLNHGTDLAYGCGAVTTWALGIPTQFSLLHGKTRRGGLVFDFADVVKDGIILPQAFIAAKNNASEQEFRSRCVDLLTAHDGLQAMFDTAVEIAECG